MMLMTKKEISDYAVQLFHDMGGSVLKDNPDILPEFDGLQLYDEPIIGFAAADDPLFETFKEAGVIGPWHMSPAEGR